MSGGHPQTPRPSEGAGPSELPSFNSLLEQHLKNILPRFPVNWQTESAQIGHLTNCSR